MKIKKIKLLKALALTGAFGIVATVPVIVSSCSSTSENNGNGNGNGGTDGNTQQTEVTPAIKSEVSLTGALSKIYDTKTGTDRETTSQLIVKDIKANPENYFTNGEALKDVIASATVTVDGGFTESTFTGEAYSVWSAKADVKKGTYSQASKQLDIKSINDLQTVLGDSAAIKGICDLIPNLKLNNGTDYKVTNNGLSLSEDLLHINVTAKDGQTDVSMDLAIPVSDLNLKIDGLKISVSGTGIKTSELTTNYKFNIGIDNTVKTLTPAAVTLAEADRTNAEKVLEKLGYATVSGSTYTLDQDKLADALGLYNCKFEAVKSEKDSTNNNKYTVTLKATPNDGYFWEDGTNGAKEEISFVATFS
uniref:Lipoprotein p35 n=1 Tax=Malacoplasma penetrans TaxID=28227 RepID=P35_MALPE|nr:RecName: Full=Lipoprotein p35; Flags: Precursor [Malacoplasma penetrans]AAC16392.1 p35 lipoprotein [Malacoplasma penetrans]prf//2120285A lipoprotein [Malacoplasma penetrans]